MFSNNNCFCWPRSSCPHLLYNTAFIGPLGIGPYRYFVLLFFLWCLFYCDIFSLKRTSNIRKQRKLKTKTNRKKRKGENKRKKRKRKRKKKLVTASHILYFHMLQQKETSERIIGVNTIEKNITLNTSTINNFFS